MNNYSNRKKILSVLFITSILCFNLVAMEGAEAPEAAAKKNVVYGPEVPNPGNSRVMRLLSMGLLGQEQILRLSNDDWNELTSGISLSNGKYSFVQNSNGSGFLGEVLKSLKDTSKESVIKILAASIITPVLVGTLEPSCSFFMKLLKKIFSGVKFPFKDGKKDEAKEINECEGALDIKRRGLDADKKLIDRLRGRLNKKDPNYQKDLDDIKEFEEQDKENVKDYFKLRKELSKKEKEYKVVAVEKDGGKQPQMMFTPQQAAALAA